MMRLQDVLDRHVSSGALPGAVALVDRGGQAELAIAGRLALGGGPMTEDAIFRLASITKPITAAGVLLLVQDRRIALDDPVREWLPEIAEPVVVRTPASPVDDVVPASRPVTVADLLTNTAGWGFASDFSLPAVQRLFAVQRDGREIRSFPDPDTWMAELAQVPMLYQPGEAWLYDTSNCVQGVLIARVSGRSLPDFLAERIFEPLGMKDTAFAVPPSRRGRLTSYYKASSDGLQLADGPDGQWAEPPAFPSGGGGLTGTARDWLAFGRMLLAGGVTAGGQRVLSAESVGLMTTDHLTPAQRAPGGLFLEGQGWGFGGSVDIAATEPWNVPGRYGWVGGTGTSAHIVPSAGTVAILLAQVAADSPVPPTWMPDFWRCVAEAR